MLSDVENVTFVGSPKPEGGTFVREVVLPDGAVTFQFVFQAFLTSGGLGEVLVRARTFPRPPASVVKEPVLRPRRNLHLRGGGVGEQTNHRELTKQRTVDCRRWPKAEGVDIRLYGNLRYPCTHFPPIPLNHFQFFLCTSDDPIPVGSPGSVGSGVPHIPRA